MVVWFTGLSGAGKTTLSVALEKRLRAQGKRVELLDGDVIRERVSTDLGFSREDREKNVERIAFIAHLLARNDVLVLVAAISPYRASREAARRLIGDFIEVHVAPPLAVCVARDSKSLYARALAGELQQLTGVNAPYEAPTNPELRIDTSVTPVDDAVVMLISLVTQREQRSPVPQVVDS
ncbi:MAG TPA: adenylyl-sulfate kinase [Polyangiaceae bacterium]|nr:adenylyl-sulfate kinase [Polyangiaceae bacterium]